MSTTMKKLILCAVAAASLGLASAPAEAKDWNRGGHDRHDRHDRWDKGRHYGWDHGRRHHHRDRVVIRTVPSYYYSPYPYYPPYATHVVYGRPHTSFTWTW